MFHAAVTFATDAPMRALLVARCPEVSFDWDTVPTEETIGEYDAIVGNPPPALLRGALRLRLLQLNFAGADDYSNPALYARPDTVLCSASGAYGMVISEYLLAAHLCLLKNLHLYRDNMARHCWDPSDNVGTITGSTVLVLGTGDIGSRYAERVRAMGAARILGVRRRAGAAEAFDRVYTVEQLDELLPQADAVAMILPGTEKTAGIMSRERLFAMKPGAVLLNAGRGSAVDPAGLYDVLAAGHLRGAALDVTSPEPLPPDSPLWTLPNLLITPHSAGGLRVRYTVQKIVELAAENLRVILDGGTPRRSVSLTERY